jgi:hypothetical protein
MACINNQIVPTPPKDWTPPPGWRPPNEKDDPTSLYVYYTTSSTILINLSNLLYSSPAKLQQQSIMGYTQKTVGTKQLVPVTKEGIKEYFLAIITTCDLVRKFYSHPHYI